MTIAVAMMVVAGYSPARTLDRVTELAAAALGVRCALLTVAGERAAHVVAGAGDAGWLLGREMPAATSPGGRYGPTEHGVTWQITELFESAAAVTLTEAGYDRMTVAVVGWADGGHLELVALHDAGTPGPDPAQRRTLQALAAMASAVTMTAPLTDPDVQRLPDRGDVQPNTVRPRTDDRVEYATRLGLLGHELRTPVTVMQGFLDTLADRWTELTEAERVESVGVVRERARQLRTLLDRLIDGARDEHQVRLDLGPVELTDVVGAAVGRFGSPARAHPVTVRLPASPVAVRADQTALGLVLDELLANAAKYSDPGSPIQVTVQPRRPGWVQLEVRDRGIGVHRADHERIFLRFWQGQDGESRHAGGVGLGLFLVRRLVNEQGGTVSVRSRQHGGTALQVYLRTADRAV